VSPFKKQGTSYVTGAITPCTQHHTGATPTPEHLTTKPHRHRKPQSPPSPVPSTHHPNAALTLPTPVHSETPTCEGTGASLTTVFHYHHSLQHHSLHLQHHSLHHPADHPPATTTPQITHLSELHRTSSSQNQTAKPNILP